MDGTPRTPSGGVSRWSARDTIPERTILYTNAPGTQPTWIALADLTSEF